MRDGNACGYECLLSDGHRALLVVLTGMLRQGTRSRSMYFYPRKAHVRIAAAEGLTGREHSHMIHPLQA
jgi:hypothetical protein